MAEHSTAGNKACAHCGNGAEHSCAGCEEACDLAAMAKIFYCSPACQVADWTNHKQPCKRLIDTKSLRQACDLIRRLWLVLRASAFVSDLEGVYVQRDGRILVYEGRVENYHPGPFWHDLFKDDKVKESVLSDRASGDALEHMRRIIDLVLKESGLVFNLQERKVLIGREHHKVTTFYRDVQHPDYTQSSMNAPRRTTETTFDDNDIKLEHRLFSVRLRPNSEQYAIDVCGAQFGLYNSVYWWSTYTKIKNISATDVTVYDWGTHDERNHMEFDQDGIRYRQTMEFNARRLEGLLQVWLQRDGDTPTKLIELDVPTFQHKLADLEDYAARGLSQTRQLAMGCAELMVQWSDAKTEAERESLLNRRAQLIQEADSWLP